MTKIETTLCNDALDEEKDMCLVDSEKLAYWYFRLNGFLTIEDFVVHPDWKSEQRTDVDLIAARFPYRVELPENPMEDDARIILDPRRIRIVLAEVKTGMCDLNDPLKKRDKRNIPRVLLAIGLFEDKRIIEAVSEELYNQGWYEDKGFVVSLCCLGRLENSDLRKKFQKMPQLTWKDVLNFIHKRFRQYKDQKCSHEHWDETGHILWKCAMDFEDFNKFRKAIKVVPKSSHPPDE